MHFTNEWLRGRIDAEPDDVSCEAGTLNPFNGERIVRAAIRIGETVYSVPPPGRHGDVFALDQKATREAQPDDQGFLTSTGRFVRRVEAWDIARFAGQLLDRAPTDGRGGELYSEDVW